MRPAPPELTQTPEEQLQELFAGANEEYAGAALGELLRRYEGPFRAALRSCVSESEIDDCLQDHACHAWAKRLTYDPAKSWPRWARQVLRRLVVERIRQGGATPVAPGTGDEEPSDPTGGWLLRHHVASEKGAAPEDLSLRPDEALAVTAEAFGAQVVGASSHERVLAVPVRVASLATQARISTASGLLCFVRAFPSVVATHWGLSLEEVAEKTQELRSSLGGHVAEELLTEPKRHPVTYGAWRPPRSVEPTS